MKLRFFSFLFLSSLAISAICCYFIFQTLTDTRSHMMLICLTVSLVFLISNIRNGFSINWHFIMGTIYFTWMSTLLIFRSVHFSSHGWNLVPFVHSFQMLQSLSLTEIIWYFGGNTLLFVPMGFFFVSFTTSLKKSILYGLIIMFVVEITQVMTNRGVFDIDDLIMNVLGIAIGGLMRIGLMGLGKNQKVHNTNC
ncbi:VanZ family protein [Shimazuella kribbensis]|uniref:VanZ family protein n=1 Tax=Shimazuella kribbensis TaxID=139808 RepID=UPI00041920F6|nr:VanZ family protein [Shimazuella kribbensis]